MNYFKKNMRQFILLIFAGICSHYSIAQERRNELTRLIVTNLDSSYRYYGTDLRKQTQVSVKYDSLFNLLADHVKLNPPVVPNEETLDRKILAIAKHLAQNPAFFTEIRQKYIFGIDNIKLISPGSPPLLNQHITEPYRLVWEYFLLKPPASGMSARYETRIADAIAGINNPASLIALEKLYSNSTKTVIPLDYPLVYKQQTILLTIGRMPSEQGIMSLVRILNMKVQASDSVKKIKWEPREFVKGMFAGKQNLRTENNWKIILNRAEKNRNIDANGRKILRDIKQ